MIHSRAPTANSACRATCSCPPPKRRAQITCQLSIFEVEMHHYFSCRKWRWEVGRGRGEWAGRWSGRCEGGRWGGIVKIRDKHCRALFDRHFFRSYGRYTDILSLGILCCFSSSYMLETLRKNSFPGKEEHKVQAFSHLRLNTSPFVQKERLPGKDEKVQLGRPSRTQGRHDATKRNIIK